MAKVNPWMLRRASDPLHLRVLDTYNLIDVDYTRDGWSVGLGDGDGLGFGDGDGCAIGEYLAEDEGNVFPPPWERK